MFAGKNPKQYQTGQTDWCLVPVYRKVYQAFLIRRCLRNSHVQQIDKLKNNEVQLQRQQNAGGIHFPIFASHEAYGFLRKESKR